MAALERAFVMADIAGSTRLWNRYPERMAHALARHDAIAGAAVDGAGGTIVKHTGDGFIAVFVDVTSAVAAMTEYQRVLARPPFSDDVVLRSRVCIHRGAAQPRGSDWFGPAMNHLARLTDLVAPTHVVLSAAAAARLDTTTAVDHLGAFSVRDFPEPVALFALDLPDSVGPALSIIAGQGLPHYRAPFVGRSGDVAAVRALLDDHDLVTLVGFGGMGKTRLAVEVATHWADRDGARAYFVDLLSSDEPMVAVAEAVGLPAERMAPDTSPAESIGRHLGSGPVLIVVDNCEHVIDGAAALCDALTSCRPETRVLATSREALEVDGEAVYPLGPLDEATALELLRQRAAAVSAGPIDEHVAARLCNDVDCMPLGIELIVARLRHLDALDLADELDDSIDELRGRRRSDSDRHATMRSVIAWSYDVLPDDEQVLLVQLAQFPAPWPRAAVSAFAGNAGTRALDGLRAKSLVMTAGAGELRLLEVVRQFCAEVLAGDEPRAHTARDTLVTWARAFIPEHPDEGDPVFDPQAARALVEQLPNIRAAIAAAERNGRGADEAALVIALWPLVFDGRARGWLGPQLEATLSRTVDPHLRRILIRLAFQDTFEHHVDTEREGRLVAMLRDIDHHASATRYSGLNHAVRQVVADRVLGLDPTPTREGLEATAAASRGEGRRLDEGLAHLYIAFSHLLSGEHAACVDAAERAADLIRRVNFVSVVALADATTAQAQQGLGDLDAALRIAENAVLLGENARWETSVRAVYASGLARAGRSRDADAAVAPIVDLALTHKVPFMLFDALIAYAAVRAACGDRDTAAEALDLTGVGRTPITIAMTFDVAAQIGLELTLDRFVESFDADAVDRRAARALDYVGAVSPGSPSHGSTVR
ncbi:MAG TPA: hypothetical protein VIB48_03725 [Acidimicrobiia bacterium]